MLSLQYRLLFIHLAEHACCSRAGRGLTALSPSGAQTPPSGPGLLRVMTTQKYFTLGAGSAFCGSVNSSRSSNAMSFRPCSPRTPCFPYTSCGISKQRGGTLLKAPGSFCELPTQNAPTVFHHSTISVRAPKTSLRNDGFASLFIHFDDYCLTISGGRIAQIIYLSKIAVPHNSQQ